MRRLAVGLFALVACRPTEPVTSETHEAAAVPHGWDYTVKMEKRAQRADVKLCFRGSVAGSLVPSNRAGFDYLENAELVGSNKRLRRRGRAIVLDGLQGGDCVRYRVDFAEMGRREGWSRRIAWVGDSLLVRPSMWLWHPNRVPNGVEIRLTFELPEGLQASAPWKRVSNDERRPSYELDPTVFKWLGYTVFGEIHQDRFQAAGAQIEIVRLDAPIECSNSGLREWITDAAESVGMLYGEFPRESLQVVVVPIEGSGRGGTVYFGAAGRGGGAGVYIMLDDAAQDHELPGGWTTVHELLHHGMPFVRDPWMGEGWVSYYTELMRTRMGHRTEEEGWEKLYGAFMRGKRGRRPMTLQRTSDRMHSVFAYQRVYWGGAAIALLTDVALRKDSGGKVSLDDAVNELRRCCGDADHKWDAKKLLAKLDAWYGKPLFSEVANKHLGSTEFPPIEDALAELGVKIDDGAAVLADDHPAAAMRRAIMAPK